MQSSILGVFVALVGNSLIGASFSVMKKAHDQIKEGDNYLKSAVWWLGTLLMICGEIGNVVAYSLAKPSLISPLGAISVAVNVPVAWLSRGDTPTLQNMLGCALCILGGYGIVGVVAGNTKDRPPMTVQEFEELVFRPPFMVFLSLAVFESVGMIWSGRKTVLAYITICSLLGAVTVLSIKAVTSFAILTMQGRNQLLHPFPYILLPILAVSCILQVQYLNKALRHFQTPQVVPIYYVLFTSCAVVGSAILYGDLNETSFEHITVFLLSFVVTAIGVYLVSNPVAQKAASADKVVPTAGGSGAAAGAPMRLRSSEGSSGELDAELDHEVGPGY